MLDTIHTFNYFLKDFLAANYPEVHFYTERDFQKIEYPAVLVQYTPYQKSEKLSLWELEAQIDIVYNEFKRAKSFLLTQSLMRYLNVTTDIPGTVRRIPKKKWVDDNGKVLLTPQEYLSSSDILWRLGSPLNELPEDSLPELIRWNFSLTLQFKDG